MPRGREYAPGDGAAGVGRSALSDYVCTRATRVRVARASGVEPEMEFAFAGLHQLARFLDRPDLLPPPQRDAVEAASGMPWRAGQRLPIGADASGAAKADGLIAIGTHVRFRHTLLRSAVYGNAPEELRRAAHGALGG